MFYVTGSKNTDNTPQDQSKEIELGFAVQFASHEDDEITCDVPPKELHQFISNYKKNIFSKALSDVLKPISWKYNDHYYSFNDDNIYQITHDTYCYFDKALLKGKYENIERLLKSADNALLHGFAKGAKARNGLKVLVNKKLITIKCASMDDRICAKKILENPNGQKLILFDEIKTHKEIDLLQNVSKNKPWFDAMIIATEQDTPEVTMPKTYAEWQELYKTSTDFATEISNIQEDNIDLAGVLSGG